MVASRIAVVPCTSSRRTPFVAGSSGGEYGKGRTSSARHESESSPGGVCSCPIFTVVAVSATPFVHGSLASQMPSLSPSTSVQPEEQQLFDPFAGPSSQVSPHADWTTPSPHAGPPPHVPLVQTSPTVHASPSLQVVPSGFAGFEHCPVCVS